MQNLLTEESSCRRDGKKEEEEEGVGVLGPACWTCCCGGVSSGGWSRTSGAGGSGLEGGWGTAEEPSQIRTSWNRAGSSVLTFRLHTQSDSWTDRSSG